MKSVAYATDESASDDSTASPVTRDRRSWCARCEGIGLPRRRRFSQNVEGSAIYGRGVFVFSRFRGYRCFARIASISSMIRFIVLIVRSSGSSVVMSTPASFSRSTGYFEPPAERNAR